MPNYRIQESFKKIKNLVSAPHPKKVKRINFAVTYLCNSKCRSCNIWQRYRNDPLLVNQELTLKAIYDLFNQSVYLQNLDEINLTGGEPLLREDFPELFKFFRSKYPSASIIINTNGLIILDSFIQDSNDMLSTVLVFSLDGKSKTNDTLRGIPGSYDKVLSSIKYFRSQFPKIKTSLSFTITPRNYRDLKEVYDISKQLGTLFTTRFVSESNIYYGNPEKKFLWNENNLEEIKTDLMAITQDLLKARGLIFRIFSPKPTFYSKLVDYQRNPRRLFTCYSATHSFFLDPYGNIYGCIFGKEPLGNITQFPFDSLWLSTPAVRLRKAISQNLCHCWTECETLLSLQRKLSFLKINGD